MMIAKTEEKKKRKPRELVIPGDPLDGVQLKTGTNAYRAGETAHSAVLGFKNVRADYVNVIPLSGRYFPQVDDLVIGCVQSFGPTSWLIDIKAPYPAPLHVNEVPWRVDFGDTGSYLNVGDAVLVTVSSVDETKRIQVGMKHKQTRKLKGGHIVEISPSKVPRVIGKSGSMINLIKTHTNTRMFVGQNGRIWIDGDSPGIIKAMEAIQLIDRFSHKYGLTDRIGRFLKGEKQPEEDDGEQSVEDAIQDKPAPEPKQESEPILLGEEETTKEESETTPDQDTKGEGGDDEVQDAVPL